MVKASLSPPQVKKNFKDLVDFVKVNLLVSEYGTAGKKKPCSPLQAKKIDCQGGEEGPPLGPSAQGVVRVLLVPGRSLGFCLSGWGNPPLTPPDAHL